VGIILIVYGTLLGLGGFIAFRKTKSGPSLVVGGFSGLLLLVCGALVMTGMTIPAYVGLGWTALLCLLFAKRYSKTKKFRPAGFMLTLSILVVVAMVYFLFI
jgi:uncharacterized membrane protein (UPF0136 family)